jgi:hypothetical protein
MSCTQGGSCSPDTVPVLRLRAAAARRRVLRPARHRGRPPHRRGHRSLALRPGVSRRSLPTCFLSPEIKDWSALRDTDTVRLFARSSGTQTALASGHGSRWRPGSRSSTPCTPRAGCSSARYGTPAEPPTTVCDFLSDWRCISA